MEVVYLKIPLPDSQLLELGILALCMALVIKVVVVIYEKIPFIG